MYLHFCNTRVWFWSLLGGFLSFLLVFCLLSKPLPNIGTNDKSLLENFISWGTGRQTTHAALCLSAFIGLFSLLRLRPEILRRWETKTIFFGLLAFLSYEYFKLIQSTLWILRLEDVYFSSGSLDLFQTNFLGETLLHKIFQSFIMSCAIFLLVKLYLSLASIDNKQNHTSSASPK